MPELSEAVVVWTGFGEATSPDRNPERLVARFGSEAAADLLPAVQALEGDFYSTGAIDRFSDLATARDVAAAEFKRRHPDLSERAVAALAWCFTFDWK